MGDKGRFQHQHRDGAWVAIYIDLMGSACISVEREETHTELRVYHIIFMCYHYQQYHYLLKNWPFVKS